MAVAPVSSGANYAALLDKAQEYMIRQTTKGWLQECLGCEANSDFEFWVAGQEVGHLEEQSSFCMRFCCGNDRPWDTKMVEGKDMSAPAILMFHRPLRCPSGGQKCCCFQEVAVSDGTGQGLGKVTEKFSCCVPNLVSQKEDGTAQYDIHQPTCCGGMMINPCAQGCCNCRVPFLVYPPGGDGDNMLKSTASTPLPGTDNAVPDAQICKVWAGLAQELLTDADNFELKAPDGADAEAKARLIAATLLINQVYFETDNKDKNDMVAM